jgi:hypothetical protein
MQLVPCYCGGVFSVKNKLCKVFIGILVNVFHESLMTGFGILRLVSLLIECSCMTPLAPVLMVMRGDNDDDNNKKGSTSLQK